MSLFEKLFFLLKGGGNAGRNEKYLSGRHAGEAGRLLRFVPVCEQAVSDIRDIGVFASALAGERGGDSGALSLDSICRTSEKAIECAKSAGLFFAAKDIPGTRYSVRTGESEVRLSQCDGVYWKIKNPFAKLHLKKHPVQMVFFESVVHNIIFPETRMEFAGVAEDNREMRIVYRQKAVRAAARPDDAQIAKSLELLGLQPEGRYSFGNRYLFVTDVGQDSDNVLLDSTSNLHFIDPIIGFKAELCEELQGCVADKTRIPGLVRHILDIRPDTSKEDSE